MITDRNGEKIKEGDWIAYRYGVDNEIGGLQVVSMNGVLGIIHKSLFTEEFIDLNTTDLGHCEVIKHGKKKD